ncbi:MAG: triose-phosphate isomerase [Flavobacteriaceae bacterium]|nr:triose-phosphate isomerase [Flavobacteriaceae bacterium]|tara:strand:+ start:922 stop:1680 length:759 start_codon:yes stop_codon:yes gene_type:complete
MRKKIVAGNWKMHNDLNETISLINELKKNDIYSDVIVMISPAFPFLQMALELVKKSNIEVVSQNVHQKPKGAFTGEISVEMLKSIGINKTIIGHSERRKYFNENDTVLLEKVKLALSNDLDIIFCFGEELLDRKSNRHFEVVMNQLKKTVLNLDKDSWNKIVLAYEPVWAIGTGETASPDQAQEMHEFIRKCILESYDKTTSENVSILYGGSVKPSNANEIFSKKDVDGGLIGGASLNAKDFQLIIKANSSL